MKENKKRIIFWFIVMVVFLILFFSGKSAYKNGYGKYGAMQKILGPIAVEFNTLEDVRRLTDIRADVSKDKLVVTYINADNKKEKYKFEYTNSNGIEYITNKDEYGTNTWSFIVLQMANAVYHANGGIGSIFTMYDSKSFGSTTVSDGLVIDENNKTVTINLRVNVVKNVAGKVPSLKDEIYAKETDLASLTNELVSVGFFKYENQDIKLYVKSVGNKYELYAGLTDENAIRVYKSFANVIKILKPFVYQKLNMDNGYPTFESSTSDYQTHTNVTFSEANVFNIGENVYQLILNK